MKPRYITEMLTYIIANKAKILALSAIFLALLFFVFNKVKSIPEEVVIGIPEVSKQTTESSTPVNRLVVSPDFVCDEYDRPGKRFSCFSKSKDGTWKPEGKF